MKLFSTIITAVACICIVTAAATEDDIAIPSSNTKSVSKQIVEERTSSRGLARTRANRNRVYSPFYRTGGKSSKSKFNLYYSSSSKSSTKSSSKSSSTKSSSKSSSTKSSKSCATKSSKSSSTKSSSKSKSSTPKSSTSKSSTSKSSKSSSCKSSSNNKKKNRKNRKKKLRRRDPWD